MKHRIPSLQDAQKAADDLRQERWPAGVPCPHCGREAVTPRDRCAHGLPRCTCGPCAGRLGQQWARGTAGTRALFAESPWRPLAGWLVLGVGLVQLQAPARAAAADLQERTAQRWRQRLAGRQGRARAVERHARAPRPRGLQLRGRAPAAPGRPPRRGVGQRRATTAPEAPAAQGALASQGSSLGAPRRSNPSGPPRGKVGRHALQPQTPSPMVPRPPRPSGQSTMAPASMRVVPQTVPACTAPRWKAVGPAYAMFGTASRGAANACSPPRRTRRMPAQRWTLALASACEAAWRGLFSTTGADWRRMTHPHRRRPRTLCYR
jgi:hypothetical protein